MRLRVLAAVTVLGAGCGSVSDNSNNPDAAIDATDMRPPMIAGSRPDMGEKGVSPLTAISIRFDEALDMASVTTSTVKAKFTARPTFYELFPSFVAIENVGRVEGSVTYEAAEHKIVFTPLRPLPFHSQIDVTLDGVKDAAGVAMPVTHLTFDVITNVDRYWTYYSTSATITSASNFYVTNGLQTKVLPTNNPGPDQTWFTTDDVPNTHGDIRSDAQGRMTVVDAFTAGPDGIYNNGDDVENQSLTTMYDATGHVSSMAINNGIGPDNVWGTPDDIPLFVIGATWQGDNFIGWAQFIDKGLDGVWRTADDKVSAGTTLVKYEYDMQGNKTRQIEFQAGADQVPNTADDVTLRYFDLTNDAHGFAIQSVRKDKGADNVWFNGDDVITGYIKYTRDAHGNATETLQYLNASSAGPDTMFMNGDDVASARSTATYNAAGQLTEETPSYQAGGDTVLGTGDDVPNGYDVIKYQTNGARITQTFFNGPGPDTMWKTADDYFSQIFTFDVQH
jgi:hypothetical protein